MALLRAAGIEARQHFVNIPKTVLEYVLPIYDRMPGLITHSFTELKLPNEDGDESDAGWQRLDSYVLDAPLFSVAQKKLAADVERGLVDVSTLGAGRYGLHVNACNHWDGRGDAFCQMQMNAVVHDFVTPDGHPLSAVEVWQHPLYQQRSGNFLVSWGATLTCGYMLRYLNKLIVSLRQEASVDDDKNVLLSQI